MAQGSKKHIVLNSSKLKVSVISNIKNCGKQILISLTVSGHYGFTQNHRMIYNVVLWEGFTFSVPIIVTRGPRQWMLERREEIEEAPGYNHVVVERG